MTGQCSNSAAIAKCTAALCALHGGHDHAVVAQPFRNLCTSLHQRQDGYVLRFEEELRLARNLAFLAYAKDDSNCIPAVCIEQDKTRGALNVRVATNTGELLLKNAVNGLQQVFDLMTSAEIVSKREGLEERIFAAILELCTPRILSRLGLGLQKRTGKIKKPLCDALENVCVILDRKQDSQNAQLHRRFSLSCQGIRKAIQQWTAYRSSQSLSTIVFEIHRFHKETDILGVLKGITRQELSETAGDSIINRIGKISRYADIARYLYRRAKTDSRYQGLKAMSVTVSPQLFAQDSIDKHVDGQLDATILDSITLSPKTITRLYGIAGSTEHKANAYYQRRLSQTIEGAKIHAEVKLVCFYELSADTDSPVLLPRAVCSSKDACWLCNTFLQLHGGMYTPRCHGVLYPSWRIPQLFGPSHSRMASLSLRMSQKMRTEVERCVTTTLARGQKITYPSPLESSLSSMRSSLSTVHLPLESVELHMDEETAVNAPVAILAEQIVTTQKDRIQSKTSSEVAPLALPSSEGPEPPVRSIRLLPGMTYHHQPTTSESGLFIEAGALHLHMEYPVGNCRLGPAVTSDHTSYKICLLDKVDSAAAFGSPNTQVINAKDIKGELQHTEDENASIFVAAHNSMVRVLRVHTAEL